MIFDFLLGIVSISAVVLLMGLLMWFMFSTTLGHILFFIIAIFAILNFIFTIFEIGKSLKELILEMIQRAKNK